MFHASLDPCGPFCNSGHCDPGQTRPVHDEWRSLGLLPLRSGTAANQPNNLDLTNNYFKVNFTKQIFNGLTLIYLKYGQYLEIRHYSQSDSLILHYPLVQL